MNRHMQWLPVLKTMGTKEYWDRANFVEFLAFVFKAIIIIPGLLFGVDIWWLYIFALISSAGLVWSSTVKTLPTLIWFNLVWFFLSGVYILKHFAILF